jgi:peptide/nickel transport system substrate-binding protein
MRKAGRAVLAVLAALAAVAWSPAAPARDRLVIGVTQFPATLHPNIESMLAKSYVLGFVTRPVTTYDHDWQAICMLCTELPTLENGRARIEDVPADVAAQIADRPMCKTMDPALRGKGVAVTYTIRPDAAWGDGTPITTDDVLFTYEVGRHEQSGVGNSELYRRILKIEVADKKTFTMHFDRVESNFAAINDFEILPAHLERAAFAEPTEYRNRTTYVTDPTNPGLWFGPYRVTRVEPGAEILLEANPTWWGPPPQIERIVVKTIENTAALEANLLSGSIDYIAGELGLTIDQAIAFERRHGADYDIVYKPVLFYEHLTVQHDHPALGDKRVRQALLHGIDRAAISLQLFGGRQEVAHTSISPLDWVYTDNVRQYAHDPARAAALLDEAGWRLAADGLRRNAAGEPLRFDLMTTAGDRARELVQQVMQSQWKALGIEARIKNEPARVLFGQTLNERRFDGLVQFAFLSAPENVPRTVLHSTMVPTAENGWAGQNTGNFRNGAFDDLLDCMDVEPDRAKREAMWHELQRLYAEELPDLPLYFRSQAFILPKWLKGVRPTGHQDSSSLWAEEWAIDE